MGRCGPTSVYWSSRAFLLVSDIRFVEGTICSHFRILIVAVAFIGAWPRTRLLSTSTNSRFQCYWCGISRGRDFRPLQLIDNFSAIGVAFEEDEIPAHFVHFNISALLVWFWRGRDSRPLCSFQDFPLFRWSRRFLLGSAVLEDKTIRLNCAGATDLCGEVRWSKIKQIALTALEQLIYASTRNNRR